MSTPAEIVAADGFRPLKRAEYDVLVRTGVFDEERVELLHGVIVPMASHDPRHSKPVGDLTELFVLALSARAKVLCQLSFAASDDSEPEPDFAVVPRKDYSQAHPDWAHLIVEVANTSLKRDRMKADLYAASKVPEYWIVNLPAQVVEVYTGPVGGVYAEKRTARPGEAIAPVEFPDVSFAVDVLLGRQTGGSQ